MQVQPPDTEVLPTGPAAIEQALAKIDLNKLKEHHLQVIRSGSRSKRAKSVHALNAIEGLQRNNLTPDKLMIRNVPVIPPVFRPFSVIGNSFVPGDANELYRDLFQYRDSHNESLSVLGEAGSAQSKLDLYDTVKALYGYGDPIAPKTKQRGVAGFLQTLTGHNPKFCYDDETEILTKNGWILFKDLPEDVDVATINPNNLYFEWERPSAYIHSVYNGELVKYNSKRVDLLVTPNHRMWLRPRRTKELLGDGSDMTKNWIVESAAHIASRGSRYWVQTGAAGWKGTSDFVPEAFKNVPVELFAEWFGWWLSDGHIHGDNSSVVVSQSYANLEYCDTLDKLFTKLSDYSITVSRRDHRYKGKMIGHNWAIIYNKELVKWCDEYCNRYCHNKRIPECILNWSVDNLSILLQAYLKGDGEKIDRHVVKNSNHKFRNKFTNSHSRFITTSKELYDNLSEIACKLGMTVIQSPVRNIKSKRPSHYREQFRGSLIGRWNTVEEGRKHISIEPYNGYVHCCSTNNGLLIVRRNGKVVVSGNSFLQRKLLSKPQDSVARGTISVNPDLSLDEVGVPLSMAWTMYAPYIQRRLVQSGMSPASALTNIKDRTEHARRALDKEVSARPVIYSRAPSWHRFNVLAGRPKLIEGDTIAINPLVTTGFNADFNGDNQLGRVLVLMPDELKANIPCLSLTPQLDAVISASMIQQNIIPTFDTKANSLMLIDLQDFPKGDLIHSKVGKNGPIDLYTAPLGLKVIAYNEKTGTPIWADVACYSVHKQREIELVALANGRQLITDDDPRAVYGVAGIQDNLTPQTFSPEDALGYNVHVPFVRDIAETCKNMESMNDVLVEDFGRVKLDWDFGYLLGAIAGDGWWNKPDSGNHPSVHIADLHGFNAARVHRILTSIFGNVKKSEYSFKKEDDSTRYGDTVRHSYYFDHARAFCVFLSRWLGGHATETSAGSGSKLLPDFFMLAPREFREGLINGLVDTDGSISVSNSKGNPQLLIAITSTSMRLICDVKYLALTLGVQATVSFSKLTKRNNTSWICTLSAPDAKRLNLFSNLATEHKRDHFTKTPVKEDTVNLMHDRVVLPEYVQKLLMKNMECPRTTGKFIEGLSQEEIDRKLEQCSLYQMVFKAGKEGSISRLSGRRVIASILQSKKDAEALRLKVINDLNNGVNDWDLVRNVVLNNTGADKSEARKMDARIRAQIYRNNISAATGKDVAAWLEQSGPSVWSIDIPEVKEWIDKILECESIAWTRVTGVQKTGTREDGYDLTVPGYETFMSVDGIILSNTMNLHVPSQDEAVQEAYDKLMPSKMLFSIRDQDKVVPIPKQELILGLYTANRRPAKATHSFNNEAEAIKAIRSGSISLSDEVEIKGSGDKYKPLQ